MKYILLAASGWWLFSAVFLAKTSDMTQIYCVATILSAGLSVIILKIEKLK
jgi:hypothetical protein